MEMHDELGRRRLDDVERHAGPQQLESEPSDQNRNGETNHARSLRRGLHDALGYFNLRLMRRKQQQQQSEQDQSDAHPAWQREPRGRNGRDSHAQQEFGHDRVGPG